MVEKPTSLVTGGAGFIGSHVVDNLINQGHKVVILDDLSGGFEDNVHALAIFVQGSITDHILVENLFAKHSFDFVFHLAAYAAEGLSHFIRRFNYQNNVIGSANLINASVKFNVKRFIFTSSIAVYGTGTLPHIETQAPKPEDPYGIAKYAIEMDLKAANKFFGLDYVIFRPHNVYGERQNISDPYRNVIGIFMNQSLKNIPLTVFGNGEQSRAFSHIQDIAPLISKSAAIDSSKNQVFNIGSDLPITINELIEALSGITKKGLEVTYLPQRNEVTHAYADHAKLKSVFQEIETQTSLTSGLGQMWKWVEKHGAQDTTEFESIELTKNLPNSWKK